MKGSNSYYRIWPFLTVVFISLSLFSYGTAMMDYMLIYPSRLIIGENEFVGYHALLEERIIPVSVMPFSVITLINIILLFRRPVEVPLKFLIISMVCLVLDWISTIFVQIPINLQLNNGKDVALINDIISNNRGRVVLESVQAFAVIKIIYHIMKCCETYLNKSVKQ